MSKVDPRTALLVQLARENGRRWILKRLAYLKRRTRKLQQARLVAPDGLEKPGLTEMLPRIVAASLLLKGDDPAAAAYAVAQCEQLAARYSFDEVARPLAKVRRGQKNGQDARRENEAGRLAERNAEIQRLSAKYRGDFPKKDARAMHIVPMLKAWTEKHNAQFRPNSKERIAPIGWRRIRDLLKD